VHLRSKATYEKAGSACFGRAKRVAVRIKKG
jgi:hypothetical protein